jgi:hypothetical protein
VHERREVFAEREREREIESDEQATNIVLRGQTLYSFTLKLLLTDPSAVVYCFYLVTYFPLHRFCGVGCVRFLANDLERS